MRGAEAQSIRSNTGVKAVCLLFSVLFIGRESSLFNSEKRAKRADCRLRHFHLARVYWMVACAIARLNSKGTVGVAGDPRWELVERIVASPCFVKSPRLCSFLIYICDLFLRGRADEINELNIGEALFDRPANYDPSADGIVRSHASRLRQRLDQYFSEEGAQEPIRLLIPKGGYMPVFEPHTLSRPPGDPLFSACCRSCRLAREA